MSLKLFGLLIFVFQLVCGFTKANLIVETDIGSIQGLSANDGDYTMFLGVPYARVNEDNAFGESTPFPNFASTFQANDDSAVCPQIEEFDNTIIGSIDCLKLNIFVPTSASTNNLLPVLVYIYGGGFAFGFGNRYLYGPSFLVRHDIILVTINYRTGPYGFTCLDSASAPGNQGLKDQVLALRWVQNHIGAFGGDADRVTVSGNSAGSMSVDFHLVSNYEKLFNKAIMQSGTIIAPSMGSPMRRDETNILSLSANLGLSTENIDEALKFLSGQNSEVVIDAASKLGILNAFGPCMESQYNNVDSFLTEDRLTINTTKVENMDIIIGINDDEAYGIFRSNNDEDYQDLQIIEASLQNVFDVSNSEFDGMADITRRFYYGDQVPSAAIKQSLIDFVSDFAFVQPTYRTIDKFLNYGAGNIFFYVFSHVGQRNFVRHKDNISNESGGALHADELGYLFDISYMKDFPMTPEDQLVIDHMTTLWANFVKFGNPTPSSSDVQWDPITQNSNKRPYLDIGTELIRGGRPFNRRAAFWDLFYKKNGHLQIISPPTAAPSSSVAIKMNQLLIVTLSLLCTAIYNKHT